MVYSTIMVNEVLLEQNFGRPNGPKIQARQPAQRGWFCLGKPFSPPRQCVAVAPWPARAPSLHLGFGGQPLHAGRPAQPGAKTASAQNQRTAPAMIGRLFPALVWLLAVWPTAAQVPGILSHQGKLTVNGTNFTGTAQFKFALVTTNALAGAQTLWSHDSTSVGGSEPKGSGIALEVARGVFSINLGDTNLAGMSEPVPASAFTNAEVFLRVWVNDGVNGSQLLVPDRRLVAAGYALVAGTVLGPATSAAVFTGPLSGDVTGSQSATVVGTVGGLSAAALASGATRASAATNTSVAGSLVQRDGSGNFAAGTITATFAGDGAGLTNLPAVAAALPAGVLLASTLAQDLTLISNGYRLTMSSPAAAWVSGSTSNAPLARAGHSAVWTGQAMLIWGGQLGGGAFSAAGGSYRPDSDTWGLISTVGAPAARGGHTTVWTGTEMIVWGGSGTSGNYLGTGGRFVPEAQTWATVNPNGAPAGRKGQLAIWTGTRMLIWGGVNATSLLDDGALYDPGANLWTPLTVPNSPEARRHAVAVWANDRLIVWGGQGATGELGTGAQLLFAHGLPTAWAALSATNAPAARAGHSAVWTGSQMLVWGGQCAGVSLGDGAAYNPQTDVWQTLAATNAPSSRYDHAALWTGAEMLIIGGVNAATSLATSAAFDPGSGQWRTLGNVGNPLARSVPGAVWSGTEILLFGGLSGFQPVAALQRLTPQAAWYFYRKL